MTAREILSKAAGELKAAGVEHAWHDAGELLASIFGISRLMCMADGQMEIGMEAAGAFYSLISRRAAREPLQYILGTQDFMGYTLAVNPDVLIPRADTETLCEQALFRMRANDSVLDLCTGSGALAIAIKKRMPTAMVTASDLSVDAVCLAQKNAMQAGAEIEFLIGDLFAPLAGRVFDMIVCNPPYIPVQDAGNLQAEVLFEPHMALFAGADGLDFYRRICAEAGGYLHPGGQILLEIGDGQADAVTALLGAGFDGITIYRDMPGLQRVITGIRKG